MMGKLSTVCLQAFFLLFTVHAFATSNIEIITKKIEQGTALLVKLDKIERETHAFFKAVAASLPDMEYKEFEYSQDYAKLNTAIKAAQKWLEQQRSPQAASSSQANTADPTAEQWAALGEFTQIRTTLKTAMRAVKDSIEQDEAEIDPSFLRETTDMLRELEEIPFIEDRNDRRNL